MPKTAKPPIAALKALGYEVGVAHSDSAPLRDLIRDAEPVLRDDGIDQAERDRVQALVDDWTRSADELDQRPTVYAVNHDKLGFRAQVPEDDAETWASLADKAHHKARVEAVKINTDNDDPRIATLVAGELALFDRDDDGILRPANKVAERAWKA